jgi:hypothetical protein
MGLDNRLKLSGIECLENKVARMHFQRVRFMLLSTYLLLIDLGADH